MTSEETSARIAKIAAKLLRNQNAPAEIKSLAASVLTQAPNKSKPKTKPSKK